MEYSVDSLQYMALKNVCDRIYVHVVRSRLGFPGLAGLPNRMKALILQKVTRSSFLLRGLDPKEMFPLLLHKNLHTVDLSCIKIDDNLLEQFDLCTELRDIRFSGSDIYYPTAIGLCKFLRDKKKLRVLHLAHCHKTTDDVIKVIVENCPDLSELVLRGCRYVTDVSLYYLSTLENLKCLDCSGTMVSDYGITTLSQGNSRDKLVELIMAYCPNLTFRVLIVVVENCVNLEDLQFHSCCECIDEEQLELLEDMKLNRLKNLSFTVPW